MDDETFRKVEKCLGNDFDIREFVSDQYLIGVAEDIKNGFRIGNSQLNNDDPKISAYKTLEYAYKHLMMCVVNINQRILKN